MAKTNPMSRTDLMEIMDLFAILPLLAGVLCVLLSIGGACLFGYAVHSERAPFGWPTAPGKVLKSHWEVASSKKKAGTRAYILYEYTVPRPDAGSEELSAEAPEGTRYTSTQVHQESMLESGDGKEELVKKYPAGTLVEVRYNPKNPSSAVLELRPQASFWGMLLLPVIPGIVGLVFCLVAYQEHKERRARPASA